MIKTVYGHGPSKPFPAKYKSNCPRCGSLIWPGMPVVGDDVNGRRRFVHQDCQNVPTVRVDDDRVIGGGNEPATGEPALQAKIAELEGLYARLAEQGKASRYNGSPKHEPSTPDPLLREKIDAKIRETVKPQHDELRDGLGQLRNHIDGVEHQLRELLSQVQTVQIEVKRPDGTTHKVAGATHECFEDVLELAAAREEIFLPGPSGCGKSHLARQVAEALGLQFGSVSCSAGMSESALLGRMIPSGEQGQFQFQGTKFLDCFENGGVFLFDEIDAADENVLLVINQALANGHCPVPSRTDNPSATRHPDFVCIAAANTYGRGADRLYVGRNQLDEATLDRFRMGTVPMNYCTRLERQLCPDHELRSRLQRYRNRCEDNRLQRIVSTRFIAKAYLWQQRGWDAEKIDAKLFCRLATGRGSQDEILGVAPEPCHENHRGRALTLVPTSV